MNRETKRKIKMPKKLKNRILVGVAISGIGISGLFYSPMQIQNQEVKAVQEATEEESKEEQNLEIEKQIKAGINENIKRKAERNKKIEKKKKENSVGYKYITAFINSFEVTDQSKYVRGDNYVPEFTLNCVILGNGIKLCYVNYPDYIYHGDDEIPGVEAMIKENINMLQDPNLNSSEKEARLEEYEFPIETVDAVQNDIIEYFAGRVSSYSEKAEIELPKNIFDAILHITYMKGNPRKHSKMLCKRWGRLSYRKRWTI